MDAIIERRSAGSSTCCSPLEAVGVGHRCDCLSIASCDDRSQSAGKRLLDDQPTGVSVAP